MRVMRGTTLGGGNDAAPVIVGVHERVRSQLPSLGTRVVQDQQRLPWKNPPMAWSTAPPLARNSAMTGVLMSSIRVSFVGTRPVGSCDDLPPDVGVRVAEVDAPSSVVVVDLSRL